MINSCCCVRSVGEQAGDWGERAVEACRSRADRWLPQAARRCEYPEPARRADCALMYAVHRKVVHAPSARFRSNSEGTRLGVLCAERVVTTVNQYAIGEGSPACVGDGLMSGHTPQPPRPKDQGGKDRACAHEDAQLRRGVGDLGRGLGAKGTRLYPLGQETHGGKTGCAPTKLCIEVYGWKGGLRAKVQGTCLKPPGQRTRAGKTGRLPIERCSEADGWHAQEGGLWSKGRGTAWLEFMRKHDRVWG